MVGTVVNVVDVVVNKLHSLFEGALVVTVQVGAVNFEPPQTCLSKRPRFTEFQQSTAKIITDVVQMWRDGVCTTSEVKIMGHIDGVTQELDG